MCGETRQLKWVFFTASGLLYLSELIEEHSRLAKLVGQRSTYVSLVLRLSNVRVVEPFSLSGNHTNACHSLLYRLIASAPNSLLGILSRRLPPKSVAHVAIHLADFPILPCVVRLGRCGPFCVVLLLRAYHCRGEAYEGVSRRPSYACSGGH